MDNQAITIEKAATGHYHVLVRTKPTTEVIKVSLEALLRTEVKAIAVSMPAALAAEFMLVQSLSLLRREGKTISVTWTDHAPAVSVQQIIQSLTQ